MEPTKPFYSVDRVPPSGTQTTPNNQNCKLCGCHPQAHVFYFNCPLLKDYICVTCCREEVPKEENLVQIQKHVECPTFDQVKATCGSCGNNCLLK